MTGFFTGGGATLSFGDPRDPNAFAQFGNRVRGGRIIEEGKVMPQTNMETKQPITDAAGKVKEQLALPLLCDGTGPAQEKGWRTDERNPNDHTDLGRRVAYIKGSLRFAVGDALRKAGASDLQVGGYLFFAWTGMGKTGNSSYVGRTWWVEYIPPTSEFFGNQPQPGAGAMPMQQTGPGQFAPQHTGFQPTQTPVTNPYAQPSPAGSGQFRPDDNGWTPGQHGDVQITPSGPVPVASMPPMQPAMPPTGSPYGYGHNPAASPGGQAHQQASTPPPQPQNWEAPQPPQSPPAGSNPWGQGPETPQPPSAPYGPPQGAGAPPTTGNPWDR